MMGQFGAPCLCCPEACASNNGEPPEGLVGYGGLVHCLLWGDEQHGTEPAVLKFVSHCQSAPNLLVYVMGMGHQKTVTSSRIMAPRESA